MASSPLLVWTARAGWFCWDWCRNTLPEQNYEIKKKCLLPRKESASFFFVRAMQLVWSQCPNQGLNLWPLAVKVQVYWAWFTAMPGNSQDLTSIRVQLESKAFNLKALGLFRSWAVNVWSSCTFQGTKTEPPLAAGPGEAPAGVRCALSIVGTLFSVMWKVRILLHLSFLLISEPVLHHVKISLQLCGFKVCETFFCIFSELLINTWKLRLTDGPWNTCALSPVL